MHCSYLDAGRILQACIVALSTCAAVANTDLAIRDIFDRDIASFGLTVPDWEGYMANPAIKFTITPPSNAHWPVKVKLFAAEARLYFDTPSVAGADGAYKELTFADGTPQSALIAVFPARKKEAKTAFLHIQFEDRKGLRTQTDVPLHIVPVESQNQDAQFPVTVDFSQDKSGFYADADHRAVFKSAVADWAFYLQDMHFQQVAAGDERTWIFAPSGFTGGGFVSNKNAYSGYLLYAYGIKGPELRSGGEPSAAGGFQYDGMRRFPLRRSGGVETEVVGNYNRLGWLPAATADAQWWRTGNLPDGANDLYSIVHHEMGHALFFNPNNLSFPRDKVLHDAVVRAYLGSDIKTDGHDHFDGFVDPVSQHGAFGNEYHGNTPYGRWLITKLDLLCLQALGYKLRQVAPLLPLSIQTNTLIAAQLGQPYHASLSAQGGVPVYDWAVDTTLPPGLSLNRYTGEISGIAQRAGAYAFTVKVRDYEAAGSGAERRYQMMVLAR
jgi:hypothetical protein